MHACMHLSKLCLNSKSVRKIWLYTLLINHVGVKTLNHVTVQKQKQKFLRKWDHPSIHPSSQELFALTRTSHSRAIYSIHHRVQLDKFYIHNKSPRRRTDSDYFSVLLLINRVRGLEFRLTSGKFLLLFALLPGDESRGLLSSRHLTGAVRAN